MGLRCQAWSWGQVGVGKTASDLALVTVASITTHSDDMSHTELLILCGLAERPTLNCVHLSAVEIARSVPSLGWSHQCPL